MREIPHQLVFHTAILTAQLEATIYLLGKYFRIEMSQFLSFFLIKTEATENISKWQFSRTEENWLNEIFSFAEVHRKLTYQKSLSNCDI